MGMQRRATRVDAAKEVSDGVDSATAAEIRDSIDRNITLTGLGNPNGTVIGYVGQIYKDLNNDKFYTCEQDGTNNWILT